MRPLITKISRTAGEIKRRQVFKIGSLYVITAATLASLAADLLPTFGVSEWTIRLTVLCLFIGFPVALILAWYFELNSQGVNLDSGIALEQDTVTAMSEDNVHLTVSVKKDGGWVTRKFTNGFTLGRSPATDVRIEHPSVSRRHARVILINGDWVLEDLRSRNGTKLNGKLVTRESLPYYSEIELAQGGPKIVITNHDLERTRLATETRKPPTEYRSDN